MINYVGQELKGLKDESFKEHTLIHLFWADSGQGTFQFLKEAYYGKLFFPYINIVYNWVSEKHSLYAEGAITFCFPSPDLNVLSLLGSIFSFYFQCISPNPFAPQQIPCTKNWQSTRLLRQKGGKTSNNKTFKISSFKLKYIVIGPSLRSQLDKVSVEKLSTVYSWKHKEHEMKTFCLLAFNLWQSLAI